MSGEVSSKINVKSMSVRNERDQEVTEGLQICGRGRAVKKAFNNTHILYLYMKSDWLDTEVNS